MKGNIVYDAKKAALRPKRLREVLAQCSWIDQRPLRENFLPVGDVADKGQTSLNQFIYD
jgi:hypothetical protein